MESIQNYEIYAYKQNATVVTSDWKKVVQRWEMSGFFPDDDESVSSDWNSEIDASTDGRDIERIPIE